MISTNFKTLILSFVCFAFTATYTQAQQGIVSINQDEKITTLLDLKKDMNKNENDSDRYKIQVYSGNRSEAHEARKEFSEAFTNWDPVIEYETPNFKIWAGNFRTRLEADRALKEIKTKFPSAFIFKPKK
jgi:hypothetical protein